jgi:hypothetical protein
MEETLLTSIARNVARHCSFSLDQIKDLFYIFKVILFFIFFSIYHNFNFDIEIASSKNWYY